MKEAYPHCPVCGEECEKIYMEDFTGIIHGCENCVSEKDAWKTPECFPDDD